MPDPTSLAAICCVCSIRLEFNIIGLHRRRPGDFAVSYPLSGVVVYSAVSPYLGVSLAFGGRPMAREIMAPRAGQHPFDRRPRDDNAFADS